MNPEAVSPEQLAQMNLNSFLSGWGETEDPAFLAAAAIKYVLARSENLPQDEEIFNKVSSLPTILFNSAMDPLRAVGSRLPPSKTGVEGVMRGTPLFEAGSLVWDAERFEYHYYKQLPDLVSGFSFSPRKTKFGVEIPTPPASVSGLFRGMGVMDHMALLSDEYRPPNLFLRITREQLSIRQRNVREKYFPEMNLEAAQVHLMLGMPSCLQLGWGRTGNPLRSDWGLSSLETQAIRAILQGSPGKTFLRRFQDAELEGDGYQALHRVSKRVGLGVSEVLMRFGMNEPRPFGEYAK